MKNPGPPLEAMLDRLTKIPEEFINFADNPPGSNSGIYLPALVNDLMLDYNGIPLNDEQTAKLFPDNISENIGKKEKKVNNYHGLAAIFCFIFEDEYFTEKKSDSELVKNFLLSQRLSELSKAVQSASDFINDPERREEICRRALDVLNYYPQSENESNSADRLLTLDSVERKKIMIKTAEAQARAKQIHDAMMQKEAEEAASKMSRE